MNNRERTALDLHFKGHPLHIRRPKYIYDEKEDKYDSKKNMISKLMSIQNVVIGLNVDLAAATRGQQGVLRAQALCLQLGREGARALAGRPEELHRTAAAHSPEGDLPRRGHGQHLERGSERGGGRRRGEE